MDKFEKRGGARPGSGRKKGGTNSVPAQGRKGERRMIALPPETWEQLDQLANEKGITKTAVVREAVDLLLKCWQFFK